MSAPQTGYQEKLDRERHWYVESRFQPKHFLNSRLFFSPERNAFNYIFPKQQMGRLTAELAKRDGLAGPKILLAPAGFGHDIPFLEPASRNLTCIDISAEAIASITQNNVTRIVGDMKRMPQFSDGSFDMVVTPLFYHHFLQFGFDEFLRETFRVLRPGGHLLSVEPSALHPMHWMTRLARGIFGNVSGKHDDEAPFRPSRLAAAMRRCGLQEVRIYGASFSHHRMPIWLAKLNNFVTFPLLRAPFVGSFAWLCLFCGRKPR